MVTQALLIVLVVASLLLLDDARIADKDIAGNSRLTPTTIGAFEAEHDTITRPIPKPTGVTIQPKK